MADVRLVDLEVFKRFSLAVRREYAPAEAVLAALDADRRAVVAAIDAETDGADGADEAEATEPQDLA